MYGIAKSQLITISENKNGQVSSLHVFHFLWDLGGREASQSQTLSLSVFLMWVSSVIRCWLLHECDHKPSQLNT